MCLSMVRMMVIEQMCVNGTKGKQVLQLVYIAQAMRMNFL